MKKMLILSLLLLAGLAQGQSTVTFPLSGRVATQEWVLRVLDSMLTNPPQLPPVVDKTDPPATTLKPCKAGPELRTITNITESSLVATFHGNDVFGIDWHILSGSTVLRSGAIEPKSSALAIKYAQLNAGTYTLRFSGNTCLGTSQMPFEIPKATGEKLPPSSPKVGAENTYELFYNTTGYGFNADMPSGLSPEWQERIEAFRYDWGWGITGIRLCVRWYEWEPTEGNFQKEGFQKVIQYCKARGLKLSVFFWPWRREGDPMIPAGHVVTGNLGGIHHAEGGTVMASLASDQVNAKLYRAVKELSAQLATYEGGYYLSVGTAAAEEYINPLINAGWPNTQIGGFEPVFQEGFRQYLAAKGLPYQAPEVHLWDRGAALAMHNENGKNFARYISLSLTRYFANFAKAVRDGSGGKILSCYMYPDAGTQANRWHLHANFAAQAAPADIMYGTEGVNYWDNDQKRLCNAINIGMGKISMVEYDPEDLGEKEGGVNMARLESEFDECYAAGTQGIHFAMGFNPNLIRAMNQPLKRLWEKYIGKPYTRPNGPYTVVPIGKNFFAGEPIYGPYWDGRNYLVPDDSDFWGTSGRN